MYGAVYVETYTAPYIRRSYLIRVQQPFSYVTHLCAECLDNRSVMYARIRQYRIP